MILFVIAAAGRQVILLAETGLDDFISIAVIVQQRGIGVQFSVQSHQISAAHGSGCGSGVAGARRCVNGSRNMVGHVVTQDVAAEARVRADIVEQVLAGKQGGLIMGDGRGTDVGSIFAGRGIHDRTMAVTRTVAVGVVDGLPYILVQFLGRVNLAVPVISGRIPTDTRLEAHLRLSGFTALGGNENNAVRTPGTIDGGRCGIFQHGNGGNVFLIQLRQRIVTLSRNAIDDNQSIGVTGTGGTQTADAQTGIVAGLGINCGINESGDGTLEHFRYGGCVLCCDQFVVNLGQGTRQVFPLGGTITHNDDIVQHHCVISKGYVDRAFAAIGDFLRRVADAGEDQNGIFGHR